MAVLSPIVGMFACGAAVAGPTFRSSGDALKEGIDAYKRGFYEVAVPALQYAAAENGLLACYYLARIYSDPAGKHTDHGKAYQLYARIVDENADADPEDDRFAPYVGKSLTALALYLYTGIPAIGLKADRPRAAGYLRYAASYFHDEEAQFELAKMQLAGAGAEAEPSSAKHWLSVLSQKGHAGAQATLAGLYWRGEHLDADPVLGLALMSLAVMNAPAGERMWIEDSYQNMYCATAPEVRQKANETVRSWRERYVRRRVGAGKAEQVVLEPRPRRMCMNGEIVTFLTGDELKVQGLAGLPTLEPGAGDGGPNVEAEGFGAGQGGKNRGAVLRGVNMPASTMGH